MIEKILFPEEDFNLVETITFAGVEFPRYLVTRASFDRRMKKVGEIMDGVKSTLAAGTPLEDAGDTHGQYHNELAWYREQDIERQSRLADSIGRGLDRAVIVGDYSAVRDALIGVGIDSTSMVALGTKAVIQYNDDPEDREEITLVTALDAGTEEGWVSIETPLAKAIDGLKKGEKKEFKVSQNSEIRISSATILQRLMEYY